MMKKYLSAVSAVILCSCSTISNIQPMNKEMKTFKVKNASQETIVNTTLGDNSKPSISTNRTNGNFVVVWEHNNGTDKDVYAQMFDSTGTPQGTEFIVNTTTSNNQTNPRVAMDNSGRFIVTWESPDANLGGIYAKIYNSSGVVTKSDYLINTSTTGNQINPAVDCNVTNGNFIIAWEDIPTSGFAVINAKRFNISGTSLGTNSVTSLSSSHYRYPSVAMASNGKFAISWQENFSKVLVQNYSSTGAISWTAPGKKVNTGFTSSYSSSLPEVKIEGVSGSYNFPVVSWFFINGIYTDIAMRKINNSTVTNDPSLSPITVSPGTGIVSTGPKMSANTNKYVVTWVSNNNAYYRRYNETHSTALYSSDSIDSSAILDNTLTSPIYSDVAITDAHTFVTAWDATDGNIYMQMHDSSGNKI